MKRINLSITIFFLVLAFVFFGGLFIRNSEKAVESSRVVSEKTVILGGQSVGIEMSVKGALIVGVEKDSGPQPGDMIISINDKPINNPRDIEKCKTPVNKKVKVTVIRNRKPITYLVKPYYDKNSEKMKLGFWIKDRIAGIGTLTFYDKVNNEFVALGHGIYETQTETLLKVRRGRLVETKVSSIQEGKKGKPGQLGGVIFHFNNPTGIIKKNTEFGLYGKVKRESVFKKGREIVISPHDQVEEGKAYFLTTIKGNKVEKFDIEITNVSHQRSDDIKSFEFRVTDKELLRKSGGIVQGMSGSPIIQNGRLIGAVTHVLVDNPKRGYGVFAEWMYNQMKNY